MADPSPDSVIVKTIGPFIATVIGTLIGWLPGGSTGIVGSVVTKGRCDAFSARLWAEDAGSAVDGARL